ncbi:hypothetical protein OQA88_895 [Cercophora sp. LCS_1]
MSNQAAFLTATQSPFEIRPVPIPTPKPNEIVIKTAASFGPAVFPFLQLPTIIGEDLAGTITPVGSLVANFKPGDHVAALSLAAFQRHVAVPSHLAIPIPSSLPFEQAAVLPLRLSVAAQALFSKSYLALRLPISGGNTEQNNGSILIWGGSTSVGSNAIQLAKAAGYEVITTASPRNFEYVKSLGATGVFDYNSPTIKEELLAAFQGKKVVGAIANRAPTPEGHKVIVDTCAAVVKGIQGANRFLACTMVLREDAPEGVEAKFVQTFIEPGSEELAGEIYGGYVAKALASGEFVATPKAAVEGKGLEGIQGAIEVVAKGVSAVKVVVTI